MQVIKICAVAAMFFSVTGCMTASSTAIGNDRYQIHSWGGLASFPQDNFITEARKRCPTGFRILERSQDPFNKDVNGSVECER